MINLLTYVHNTDNCGAKLSKCITLPRRYKVKGAGAGDKIRVLVKVRIVKRHIRKKSRIISKGQICNAIVTRHNGSIRRWGNFRLTTTVNAVVLVNEYYVPYATRIFGVVFKEVRQGIKYKKIIALAKSII